MTKLELKNRLRKGEKMENLFSFIPGQDCEIFKADEFHPGEEIIYIPDIYLNAIIMPCEDEDDMERIVECCYTGDEFIELCGGDIQKAMDLFAFCDWQHPSSARVDMEDEEC